MQRTLYTQLIATAERHPHRDAIFHDDTRWTWNDVRTRVDACAAGLLDLGIRRGDRVAVWLPNIPQWPLLWLATASIGATLVPVNTRYQAGEAAYLVEQSGARALFYLPRFLDIDYQQMVDEIRERQTGDLQHAVAVGGLAFDRLAGTPVDDRPDLTAARAAVSPDDDVILLYTSGTTGVPKGVPHTHHALSDVAAMAELMAIDEHDRILAHMPFFHVAGSFMSILTSLHTGCALACVEKFTGEAALEEIQARRCTVVNGVPSHFFMMLAPLEDAEYDLHSARIGWIAGATIPGELVCAVRERFGMELLVMYGLTETTGVATATSPGDPIDLLLDTVGMPIADDYEVAVYDPITLEPVNGQAEGEVWIRGHRVTRGYYRLPEQTAAVLCADGWFRTGDLGRIRHDGRLQITGRRKDLIIVGGTNVSPAEIENVIVLVDAVAQAHVVGVPEARLGEVAVAYVELKPGQPLQESAIIDHCLKHLAKFKVPRHVEFVTEFPTTAAGKVQKHKLREKAVETYGPAPGK